MASPRLIHLGLAVSLAASVLAPCSAAADLNPNTLGGCFAIYGTTVTTNKWSRIDGKAALTCPAPNGPLNSTLRGRPFQPAAPMPVGSECEQPFDAPVSFTVVPGGWTAYFDAPEGGPPHPLSTDDTQPINESIPTYDYVARYIGYGHWDGSNCLVPPGVPPTEYPGGLPPGVKEGWVWADCSMGRSHEQLGYCLYSEPHPITPNEVGMPAPPPILDVENTLRGEVRAGQVATLPTKYGLVNLPVCFWLEGVVLPQDEWWQIILASPPDWSGREIYYVFQVHAYLREIRWNWGDGTDWADSTSPPPECGDAATHPGLAAHAYQRYSDDRPDGSSNFKASASVIYGLDVTEFWDDSNGPHAPQRVTQGVPTELTATTDDHSVHVVQEMPVPIGG